MQAKQSLNSKRNLCFYQNGDYDETQNYPGRWMGLTKRLIKPIPVVGSLFAVGLAGYEIKKKGLIPGAVHVGLDVTPVVGTAKGVVELFTGDLIPDKSDRRKPVNLRRFRNVPYDALMGGLSVNGRACS